MIQAKVILNDKIRAAVEKAISEAELHTSGEIVVHAEDSCIGNPYNRAVKVFDELGLYKTELSNAVLIYLAIHDRKLSIIGDTGIHKYIQQSGWDVLASELSQYFARNEYEKGLVSTIHKIGQELSAHFPYLNGDRNELSNQINFPQ